MWITMSNPCARKSSDVDNSVDNFESYPHFLCNPVDNWVIHILSTRYPHPPVDNSWICWYKRSTSHESKHKIAKQNVSKNVVLTEINIDTAFGISYPQFYINMWITLWIIQKTLHKIFYNYPHKFSQYFLSKF